MQERGYRGSLSGGNISTIHGDLITEIYNGETTRTAGPFRSGYSTDINTVNTWVKTSHINARLQTKLRERINLQTSAVYKESISAGKLLHDKHVEKLKQKLGDYNIDPFGKGPARHLTTGKELDHRVVKDLLDAPVLGNE